MRKGSRAEAIDGALARANIAQRHGEGPADIVGALGWASRDHPAGREAKHLRASLTDLHNASEARRAAKHRPAISALEATLLDGPDAAFVVTVASIDRFILLYIALLEWMAPWCETCHGAGALSPPGQDRIVCVGCNGFRRQRFTNEWREGKFGQPLTAAHRRLIRLAQGEIATADSEATGATVGALG